MYDILLLYYEIILINWLLLIVWILVWVVLNNELYEILMILDDMIGFLV